MKLPRIPPDLTDRYLLRHDGGAAAVVRDDFAEVFERHGLLGCADPHPRQPAGPGPEGGRARPRLVPAGPLGEAVVRRYLRGGLARPLLGDRYLYGSRAFHELVVTERLRRRGVPVPEVLAAVQRSRRPGYSACIVTRRLPGAETAARVLARSRPGECRAWLEEIGHSVRRLHEAGSWHADLNAHNVLLFPGRPGIPPLLIDFDRSRLYPGRVPRRRARGNLRRLRRSLSKLGLNEALRAWPALEHGYGIEPEPEPAA